MEHHAIPLPPGSDSVRSLDSAPLTRYGPVVNLLMVSGDRQIVVGETRKVVPGQRARPVAKGR